MSYKKALRKLESLPPGEQQLAAGQYVWQVKGGKSHCGCAIGKLLTERQRVKLFGEYANKGGVNTLADSFLRLDYTAFNLAGLSIEEASALQNVNDSTAGGGLTGHFAPQNGYSDRKARYKMVIAWLREKVKAEEAA